MRVRYSLAFASALVSALAAVPARTQHTPVATPAPTPTPVPVPVPVEYAEVMPFCPDVIHAYVDPATGCDPVGGPGGALAQAQLGDPKHPFNTIQFAIDACHVGLTLLYNPTTHPDVQGIVVCMPGEYGPGADNPVLPVDTLPIRMKDRVSVQGSGARRTVLRGSRHDPQLQFIFWPDQFCCGNVAGKEILVDFSFEHPGFSGSPWGPINSEEMWDGFTFELGNVQVYCNPEIEALARVSNCVFDLRTEDLVDMGLGVVGPDVGILLTHIWDLAIESYHDIPMRVFNNTFVFGEFTVDADYAFRPPRQAFSWTVGILDVVNPLCQSSSPCTASPFGDPITTLRGFSELSIQNNLFRTLTDESAARQVMLGVDTTDTAVLVGGGSNPGDTNAFSTVHIGLDHSTDVATGFPVLWSAIPGFTPTPKVDLAVPANDPAFIGEIIAPSLAPAFKFYRDWRLTPSGPGVRSNVLQDQGSHQNATGHLVAVNGNVYVEPFCSEFWSFDWDGEGFGNRRINNEVDIGFDEVHLMLTTGVWDNDSCNFHNLDPFIDPSCLVPTASRRIMIFQPFAAGAGNAVVVHSINTPYGVNANNCGGVSIPAWDRPPGTTGPFGLGGLPAFYQWRYIPLTDPTGITPWAGAVAAVNVTNPVNGLLYPVGVVLRVDPDGAPPAATYFDLEAVVTVGGNTFRGNLQAEYR